MVQWKRFIIEYNTWEKKKKLENIREVVVDFEGRISTEVRKQEKLKIVKEQDFRRHKFPEKYIAKILYEWDNRKFKKEYLRKLERNWQR